MSTTNPDWICSACLYVRPRPGLSDDDLAATEILTVINGHLICMRHAGAAQTSGGHHVVISTAVLIESGDEHMSLTAYQEWRGQQDRSQR